MTTDHFDALETRDASVRELALMNALPAQVRAAQAVPAGAALLAGVDADSVTSRAALARLPVTRKHELLSQQQAARSAGGDPFGGWSSIGWSTRRRPGAPPQPRKHRDGSAVDHIGTGTGTGTGTGYGYGPDPGAGMLSPADTARRVFQSPGPIYEPQGAAPDAWRSARALHAAGFRAGDLVHNSFSYHLTPGAWIMEAGAHALGCTVFPGGVGNTELQLQAMADLGPDGYAGTPSFLRILLEKAAETGVALPTLKRALLSGEAFPAALRVWFAERGVDAFQAYATADVGVIAYETPARQGLVVDEGVVLEIVRPGTGHPVPDGEVGEVVVTVFGTDYPLLRFGTGDLSAVLPGASPCGRTNTRIRGWLGRADQTAKVRGMFVHPGQVDEVRRRHPEIARARLVVEGEMADDRMTLHAECATDNEGFAAAIAASVREVTKLRCDVMLCLAGALPNDGKVIDDLRRPG